MAFSLVGYLCCHSRYMGRSRTAEDYAFAAFREFHFSDCTVTFSHSSDYEFPFFPYVATRESGRMTTTVQIEEKPTPTYNITVKREGDRVPLLVYAGSLERFENYNICETPNEISAADGHRISKVGYLRKWILGGLAQD